MEDYKKENMPGKDNSGTCHCPWHNAMQGKMSCCGGKKHMIIRILLCLCILGIVFWGGVKLGELKSMISNRYSPRTHMRIGYRMPNRGFNNSFGVGGPGAIMMNWKNGTSTKQQ